MLLGGVPYLVRTGKGLRTLEGALPPGTQVFDDLAAVVDHLLESSR
ncbi:histidinol-phosphate phosphatase family protein [Pseudomonas sp. BAY1663]|nr:histidinol-phosphate phosphatase family protein [Pseudomonas sp. BAY1663]